MSEASFTDRPSPGSVADLREWAMRQPTVGRCLFCPSYAVTGSASEVRAQLHEHRELEHPNVPARSRRKRKSGSTLYSFRQKLNEEQTEEIAANRRRRMIELGIP